MAEKSKKNKRLIGSIVSLAGGVLVVVIAVVLILNRDDLSASGLERFFSFGKGTQASEIAIGAQADAASAVLGDALLVYDKNELVMYDGSGKELLYLAEKTDNPMLAATDKYAVAYGIGDNKVLRIDKKGEYKLIETDAPVISASVSDGGIAVVTQSGSYKGVVTVYNSECRAVYKLSSATAYVTCAALSPSGNNLAVAGVTSDGGKIAFFNTDSESEKSSYVQPGSLILEMHYMNEERVAATTQDSMLMVEDGKLVGKFDFAGAYLMDYDFGDGFSVLLTADDKWSQTARLTVIDTAGKSVAEKDIVADGADLSAHSKYIALLSDGKMVCSGKSLEAAYSSAESSEAEKVIVCNNGTIYLIQDYLAQRIVP